MIAEKKLASLSLNIELKEKKQLKIYICGIRQAKKKRNLSIYLKKYNFFYFTELQKLHLQILCINKLFEMQLKNVIVLRIEMLNIASVYHSPYCLYLTHGFTSLLIFL